MAQVGASGSGRSGRNQVLLLVLVCLAGLLLYWQFVYSPLKEERQHLNQVHSRLAKENKKLKDEARAQREMIKCKPELDALNRQNELMLPADPEPVAFLKVLTNLAGTTGLAQGPTKELRTSQVTAPPPGPPKNKGQAQGQAPGAATPAEPPCWEKVPGLKPTAPGKLVFVRVPFDVELRGTYYQLVHYFWLLYQNAQSGRIITVENLRLTDPTSGPDGVVVTAKFVAVGYREVLHDGQQAGATGAGRTGLVDKVRKANQMRASQLDSAAAGKAPGAATSTPARATPAPAGSPAHTAPAGGATPAAPPAKPAPASGAPGAH